MSQDKDPYLEQLLKIQEEVKGIDLRLNALEEGYALDANEVDEYVQECISEGTAQYKYFLDEETTARIAEEYEAALKKGIELDAVEYALSAIVGIFCGVIDAVFSTIPHEKLIGKTTDEFFDEIVMSFAKKNGWPAESDEVYNAIAWLERRSGIHYDQATSKKINYLVERVSPSNHHAKSAGHYPDIVGLIASIANQWTNTSTFYDTDKGTICLVRSASSQVELQGNTAISKIYAGTINWLWHCMSDVAGASSTRRKGEGHEGSGLPIPFTEFFMLCARKENENDESSFANLMCSVYEEGYDARHGVAMTFPVLLNSVLLKALYVIKMHYYEDIEWAECLSKMNRDEYQRMSTVGIGAMCIVDLTHAGATSFGNAVDFFMKLNLPAWSRLAVQGVNELKMAANRETCNIESIQEDIDKEWNRLLEKSKDFLA